MLEYIFFDGGLRAKFVRFVQSQGVECLTLDEGGLIAKVPEELADALAEAIDHCYEKLLQENAELLEGTEDALVKNVAGVGVQLADGSSLDIPLDPDLVSRMLAVMSMEELRDMVQAIAAAVENPDHRPICQKV